MSVLGNDTDSIGDNWWTLMEQLMTTDCHWLYNWWRLMNTYGAIDDKWWTLIAQLMKTDDTIDEQWWQLMTIYAGASPQRICLTRKTWAQHLNVCVGQRHWLNWWKLMNLDGSIDVNWWPLIAQLMNIRTTDYTIDDTWWKLMQHLITSCAHWWYNWWQLMATDCTIDDDWSTLMEQLMTSDDNIRSN